MNVSQRETGRICNEVYLQEICRYLVYCSFYFPGFKVHTDIYVVFHSSSSACGNRVLAVQLLFHLMSKGYFIQGQGLIKDCFPKRSWRRA